MSTAEDRVGNSLLQIWKLRFGHKAKLLFRLWAQGLVKILKLKFRQDFEAGVCSAFCCWCFVEVMKLNLGRDSEAGVWLEFFCWCFVQVLKLNLGWDSETETIFWILSLVEMLMLMTRIILATVCCRFGSWGLIRKVKFLFLSTMFGQDFEVEVQAWLWSWSLVNILPLMFCRSMKLNLGRDSEAKFGQDFKA